MKHHPVYPSGIRRGFLSLDVVASFAVLALGAFYLVQTLTMTNGLRQRNEIRMKGLEVLTNVLEAARGVPPEQLEVWAAKQGASPDLEQFFSKPKLAVAVKKLPDRPLARQVEVSMTWLNREGIRIPPMMLTAVVAVRTAPEKGSKP